MRFRFLSYSRSEILHDIVMSVEMENCASRVINFERTTLVTDSISNGGTVYLWFRITFSVRDFGLVLFVRFFRFICTVTRLTV